MTTRPGLILFAHGARDPRWTAPFEAVAARVRAARPDAMVRLAYLEFIAPTLPDAGAGLVEAGCDRIEVVPLFLGAGGHVRKDVPVLLEQMRARCPGVAVTLHTAIGELDPVIEAIAAAAAASLGAAP